MAPKKLRAKRARAHWREKRGHDLTSQYRETDLPAAPHVAVVDIEDALQPAGRVDKFGQLHVEAQLEPVRHRDGTLSEGAPAWTPPQRPTARVVVNLREDPLGRMRARHQVDAAQYNAARAYQKLYDVATIGNIAVADLLRPKVDGGRVLDPISSTRIAATKRLHQVEGKLKDWHGFAGLSMTRLVLTSGKTIDKAASDLGAKSSLEKRFWGLLFRKCLDVLAKALGFANSAQRPRLPRAQIDSAPDPRTADLRASNADLTDKSLRQGRPNGGSNGNGGGIRSR
jgi:hypothetical protein